MLIVIFQLYQKKRAFACQKAHANVFFTYLPRIRSSNMLGLSTADSENSVNDGAQDDSGWITVNRKGKMSKHGHKGHSMTNCHSMTKGHSMTNHVCGIMSKNKAEQKAHKSIKI